MGAKNINKIGEENYNHFGSKMIIIEYRGCNNLDIYFPEFNWIGKDRTYSEFKKGTIKCPYEPRVYGKGYIGEGVYKMTEDKKSTKYYDTWKSMIGRCYDFKKHKSYPSYVGCEVEDYLLNFQQAAEFFNSIYYEVPGEKMCLDKDILKHGNKIYSRESCIFVPEKINTLFVKNKKTRGKFPIGVYKLPSGNYQANCSNGGNKSIYLGSYSTQEKAFQVYKEYKEEVIKEVINSYGDTLPQYIREILYSYKVEMND